MVSPELEREEIEAMLAGLEEEYPGIDTAGQIFGTVQLLTEIDVVSDYPNFERRLELEAELERWRVATKVTEEQLRKVFNLQQQLAQLKQIEILELENTA